MVLQLSWLDNIDVSRSNAYAHIQTPILHIEHSPIQELNKPVSTVRKIKALHNYRTHITIPGNPHAKKKNSHPTTRPTTTFSLLLFHKNSFCYHFSTINFCYYFILLLLLHRPCYYHLLPPSYHLATGRVVVGGQYTWTNPVHTPQISRVFD